MEHKQFEDFWESAKKVRLSAEEKARGRELLLRYTQMNPVRYFDDGRRQLQRSWFQEVITTHNILYKSMAIALVLLVTVAAGGGVSLAAENALPGDVLYPVKVEVNENVRSALAFSEEAKAEWKVEQTERRLEETEKLAVKGEFDSKAAAKVEAKFEQHTQKLSEIASKLEAEGRVEAAAAIHSNLEAVLDAHEKILTALQSETNGQVEEILVKVKVKTQEAKEARAEAEAEVSAKTGPETEQAAEGKLNAAQNKVQEVARFLEQKKATVSAEAFAQAEAKLQAANEASTKGETQIEAGAHGDAFASFQEAIRLAQQAKSFAQVSAEIGVEIGVGEGKVEDALPAGEDDEEDFLPPIPPEIPIHGAPPIKDSNDGGSEAPGAGTETEIQGSGEVEVKVEL